MEMASPAFQVIIPGQDYLVPEGKGKTTDLHLYTRKPDQFP